MRSIGVMLISFVLACGGPAPPSPPAASSSKASGAFVLQGATVPGQGQLDIEVTDGVITALGPSASAPVIVDVSGKWIVPAFVDSHVHLAFLPLTEAMLDGGVAAVLDWGSPTSFFAEDHGTMEVLAAGPMITAVNGYPTQSWGANGYGAESADLDAALTHLDQHRSAGASLAKFVFAGAPELPDATIASAAVHAHGRGMASGAHALGDSDASRAAAAGIETLVHTPTQAMSSATLDAWADGNVISTLAAFGSGFNARNNLSQLRNRGTKILYGTDFGNLSQPGIAAAEVSAMMNAGFTGEEIVASGTSTPASLWPGLKSGRIAVGAPASVLVLATDPYTDPMTLTTPEQVYICGALR